jgi:hypothetical protein
MIGSFTALIVTLTKDYFDTKQNDIPGLNNKYTMIIMLSVSDDC